MEPQRNWKAVEAGRENTANKITASIAEDEQLPAYEAEDSATPSILPEVASAATQSTLARSHSSATHSTLTTSHSAATHSTLTTSHSTATHSTLTTSHSPAVPSNLPENYIPAAGPSVSSPFNFPTADLATYCDPTPTQKPVAIPQRWPEPSAPFLTAYAPVLLNYGIPAKAFHSFLDTLSAFLTAKVSKRAISHASDIAASVGRVPKQLAKDLVAQAKDTGRGIATSAKKGNPIGVVGGLLNATLGMTIGVALRSVNSIVQLPAAAAMAAANPKTPRGRAELYIATANKDWFGPRGLNARLLDTVELTNLLGIEATEFLTAAGPAVSAGKSDEKLKALRGWIADVEVWVDWRDWGTLSRRDTPLTMPDPKPLQAVNTVDAFSIEPDGSAGGSAVGSSTRSSTRSISRDMKKDVGTNSQSHVFRKPVGSVGGPAVGLSTRSMSGDMRKYFEATSPSPKSPVRTTSAASAERVGSTSGPAAGSSTPPTFQDMEKDIGTTSPNAVSPLVGSTSPSTPGERRKEIETTSPTPISPLVDTTSAFSVEPVDTTSAFAIVTNRDHVDTTNAFAIVPTHNVDTTSAFSIEKQSLVAAGKRPVHPLEQEEQEKQEKGTPLPPGSLRLGIPTLWLVLFPAERTSTVKEKTAKFKWSDLGN
ncbi:putative subunit of the rna polymerase ii mediator complex protein [Venturia nashicola]|uniref:Putative subunit of the rna polymerase ii mediator complex protein n=1 Tax=Venturia nashicola TaxID=86259 RepID=A0A4Z1PBA9_9PEZI|nr:putative subunit of the rna polymerase ii mediator complex protein [Venturia nashicola]TLD35300.1 putative subunit of the rna polymerase ii mediator complex protein [Venturia nashicola]